MISTTPDTMVMLIFSVKIMSLIDIMSGVVENITVPNFSSIGALKSYASSGGRSG